MNYVWVLLSVVVVTLFALFVRGLEFGPQALMGTLATQFIEVMPAILLTILFKAPLALLVWRVMLWQFDRYARIDFRSDYHAMEPADRARYLGMRNLAAAIVIAGVFVLS